MLRSVNGPLLAALVVTATVSAQDLRFRNVTSEAGLNYLLDIDRPGVSAADYDGDGWMDVCFVAGHKGQPQIFRNNGAAIQAGVPVRWFSNVTREVMRGPGRVPESSLALFADLDNDGDKDIVSIKRFPSDDYPEGDADDTGIIVYEQQDGLFSQAATPPNLGRSHQRMGGLAVADLDMDSFLDIVYVHNGGGEGDGGPGFCIRNLGGMRFGDATSRFGADIGTQRRYFSVLLADFNGDMRPDMHCAVDFFRDYHCWNNGDGTFTDVTAKVGATNRGSDMGLAIGDIENDGDMDIYSTNINEGILYVNDGTGHFTQEAQERGVGSYGLDTVIGWGTAFVDLDNDGDEDLVFVANQNPGYLYQNDGTGHFTQVTDGSFLRLEGHGLVPLDYDRDGAMDLLVLRGGVADYPYLFRNQSPALEGNHWLVVELEGTASNRDGIGAKVEVFAGPLWVTRMVMGGYSFKSAPPSIVHFGLGTARVAATVRVTWPSGTIQDFHDVPGDRYLRIVEPGR